MKWFRLWAPVLIWAGVLLYLGTRTPAELPSTPPGTDKLAHLAFYGVLGICAARAGGNVGALLAGLLVGALDEWLQAGVSGRAADWLDLAADILGATGLGWLYLRTRWNPRHH